MADSPEEIQKASKLYLLIGATLFVCTVLTVAVAKFEFLDFGQRGFDGVDATIGLLIALFKSSLVAAIFMHLNHEKKLVYWTFGSAIFFGACLMLLTGLAFSDPIQFQGFFGR
ncbi:cytochrome C oxidase subunit IV family protein [Verrucomicrobiaceae bacterium N1E253]|uniref:Cytochrome C oxidase subunit IV family protein n=1 Tax=Oceaniferula marina TaxID=2748318 RepID=A0A851GF10_9BACT|nr:cytochrome C oxidase subunit IV family protein [Oceaniferula marina]NWK55482.1 cytochrome C oxidase subunit IV family protein [Oceaniferula marina]